MLRVPNYFKRVGESLHASRTAVSGDVYPELCAWLADAGIDPISRAAVLHLTPQQYSALLGCRRCGHRARPDPRREMGGPVRHAMVSACRISHCGALPCRCWAILAQLVHVFLAVALVGLGYACIIPAWNALIAQGDPERGERRGVGLLPDDRRTRNGVRLASCPDGYGTSFGPMLRS